MKELVEMIVRALVDSSDEVEVREIETTKMNVLEIKASKQDMGKLIGKKGKNITAIRRIVTAAGKGKGYMVELIEENRRRPGNSHDMASDRQRHNQPR